jgi:RNA recognition motif-containing protein
VELETLFSEVGQLIEVFLPSDRNTGRPRGFAFVEFEEESAASAAIEKFDGFQLNGRDLRVTVAQERARRPGFSVDGPPGAGHRGHGRPKPKGSRRNIRGSKRRL